MLPFVVIAAAVFVAGGVLYLDSSRHTAWHRVVEQRCLGIAIMAVSFSTLVIFGVGVVPVG